MTAAGTLGYAWHEHTITKLGDIVTWAVDGIDLIVLDTSNFTTPTGGDNIFFGHGDVNNGSSTNARAFDLLFTLVDNVEVNVFTAPTSDTEPDGDVDGQDFLELQLSNPGGIADWELAYGTAPLAAVSSVPEPTSLVSALLGLLGTIGFRFRSRRCYCFVK